MQFRGLVSPCQLNMASPHHRHQSSLAGILNFSSPQPLEPDQRNRATDIFNQIVAQYEPCQTDGKGYKRITLLRVAHDSVISRDNFLSWLFLFVEKELRQGEDVSELSLSQALSRYLVDNFFLPRTQYMFTITAATRAHLDLGHDGSANSTRSGAQSTHFRRAPDV
jgi:hypothetical protein